jgi:glycosyltransferase involved in cell wall biosynthesis
VNKKRIALITPSLAKGGLEKVVVTAAPELAKFYDVTVIVMDTFRTDYPYEGELIDLGLSWENRNLIWRLINFAKAVWRLRGLKKKHHFDLVIGHGELASFPNILSGVTQNVVVIHENRFAAMKDFQGRVVNRVLRRFLRAKNVSKIVTVSEGIRESLVAQLQIDSDKIATIHNPYEIREIRHLAREGMGLYERLFAHPVIVAVGRLIPAKGHWYLLRIFAQLKSRSKDTKLLILGEGILQEKLIAMSVKLGLKTYSAWSDEVFDETYDVYFLGFHQNPFRYMAASRLFVMTSVWEGFGNTIVEAMACGLPVVSADCPSGPGEILNPLLKQQHIEPDNPNWEGSGVLMPAFENRYVDADAPISDLEGAWVDVIGEFLDSEEKVSIFSQKGRLRAEDFRVEVVTTKWKVLLDEILF